MGYYLWVGDELPVEFCIEGLNMAGIDIQHRIANNTDLWGNKNKTSMSKMHCNHLSARRKTECRSIKSLPPNTNKQSRIKTRIRERALPPPASACTAAHSGPGRRSHLQWRSGQWTSAETSGSTWTQRFNQDNDFYFYIKEESWSKRSCASIPETSPCRSPRSHRCPKSPISGLRWARWLQHHQHLAARKYQKLVYIIYNKHHSTTNLWIFFNPPHTASEWRSTCGAFLTEPRSGRCLAGVPRTLLRGVPSTLELGVPYISGELMSTSLGKTVF